MTGFVLLETDVFSHLWTGRSLGDSFRRVIERRRPCVSFATVAELYKGAANKGWGATKLAQLETHLEATLVVPYDIELSRICGGSSPLASSGAW